MFKCTNLPDVLWLGIAGIGGESQLRICWCTDGVSWKPGIFMTLLARATVCLVMLAFAAGCRTTVDPLAISDAQTAARVKTALVNDPDLGTRAIEVRVALGVVELSGRVLTQAEADRAVEVARGVAGVVRVRRTLQIGGEEPQPPEGQSLRPENPELDLEFQGNPDLLAVGASIGSSAPRTANLQQRAALSPLIRIGSGKGLGVAVGLNWFRAELQSLSEPRQVLIRVQIKPVMVGASYTLASERTSLSASVVGGYAWNSLTVTDTGTAAGLPVEVDNSLVWRPGASLWYDVNRRTALNLTIGYVITRLQLTVLEDGRLEKRPVRGDTTIVSAGIAYKLF